MSRRVFGTCLSWMTDVWLGYCVFVVLDFPLTSEGRTLARAVAMSDAVSLRVVPAWPMGMPTRSTRPQYRRRALRRGGTSRSSLCACRGGRGPCKIRSRRGRGSSPCGRRSRGPRWGPLAFRGRR